jgi:type I restriction enzyme S subunit
MNAERLLAHFERISEAPDAIARLRRFILDLAVRGKLVEQDPEDEPAEVLLTCVAKHNKSSLSTASDKSSFPFELPAGWTHITFRTLVQSSGSGWSPKALDTPREGNEWGILKVSAVSWHQFRPEANKQVLPGTQPRPQAVVRKGDFLISRANTAELVARAVIVDSEPVNLMMSDKIVRLELVDLCDPKYILINNNHSTFSRGYYAERATGVSPSMKNVTRDVILDLPIPLPPLAEQHRIVAKVDELMALCDQLEAARQQRVQGRERLVAATLQRLKQPAADPASFRQDASFALQVLSSLTTTPAQIKQLRQTILNLAVRGKLVEQDPEDEPAEELLAAITSEKQQAKGSRKASPRSADFVLDGPFGVPTSWQWTQLGAIGDWGSGSTPSRGRSDYYGGAISWFKSGELNDNKCLRGSEEKITHLALEQCSFRLNSPGDVLIAMYGATIGKLAILGEEAVTNQAVCACTPCWGVDTEYLYLFLLAQRDEFRLASEGGAQPNISKVKIVNTLIPLPPLAEQHRIVAKVDELMALCDQLEQQLSQADQQRRRLLEAVLAEALGGRLPIEQEESHAAIA